jgi:hypothetical protein
LASVLIPDGVTSIGKRTFCNNKLTNVAIAGGVTAIRKQAFLGNRLERVVIGLGVKLEKTALGEDFDRCYNDNEKQAGRYVFHNFEWSFTREV